MREERIVIAGRELLIARPDDPESLIDEERFEEDEFLPYWAELWPSGVALAGYVATLDLAGRRVLELGCGLALPSFAAALAGADVLRRTGRKRLSTSWRRTLQPTGSSSRRRCWTGVSGRCSCRRSTSSSQPTCSTRRGTPCPCYGCSTRAVAEGGYALVADPGRRHAAAFFDAAAAGRWGVELLAAGEIPNGEIGTAPPGRSPDDRLKPGASAAQAFSR